MNKRHFSLIELLITIAVIAILAGLLMPALNMAKQKAIDLHCINNLKQFGTAFMTYRSDSEDKMPMWSSDLYPIYMASAKTYECKRDMNRKNITFPSTEWRLNVPGAATDERKFVEAYDYPSSQAEEGRSVPAVLSDSGVMPFMCQKQRRTGNVARRVLNLASSFSKSFFCSGSIPSTTISFGESASI